MAQYYTEPLECRYIPIRLLTSDPVDLIALDKGTAISIEIWLLGKTPSYTGTVGARFPVFQHRSTPEAVIQIPLVATTDYLCMVHKNTDSNRFTPLIQTLIDDGLAPVSLIQDTVDAIDAVKALIPQNKLTIKVNCWDFLPQYWKDLSFSYDDLYGNGVDGWWYLGEGIPLPE